MKKYALAELIKMVNNCDNKTDCSELSDYISETIKDYPPTIGKCLLISITILHATFETSENLNSNP